MLLRDSDIEWFEDDPDDYMKKDIEGALFPLITLQRMLKRLGSDVETRRRAAADFVRALCKQFEAQVVDIFRQYIQQLLGMYASDKKDNWRYKEVCTKLCM